MSELECNACDWRGPRSEAVHFKHDASVLLCPECKETTVQSAMPTSNPVTKQVEEGMRLRHAAVEESGDKLSAASGMAYLSHLDRGELLGEVERLRQVVADKEADCVRLHKQFMDAKYPDTASPFETSACPHCGLRDVDRVGYKP